MHLWLLYHHSFPGKTLAFLNIVLTLSYLHREAKPVKDFFFFSVKDCPKERAELCLCSTGSAPASFISASGGVWLVPLFSLGSGGSKRLPEWPAQPLCLPADHPPEGRTEPGDQGSLWWAPPFLWLALEFTQLSFITDLSLAASWLLICSAEPWVVSLQVRALSGWVCPPRMHRGGSCSSSWLCSCKAPSWLPLAPLPIQELQGIIPEL